MCVSLTFTVGGHNSHHALWTLEPHQLQRQL